MSAEIPAEAAVVDQSAPRRRGFLRPDRWPQNTAGRMALTVVALAGSGSTSLLFGVAAARALPPSSYASLARSYAVALIVAQLTMAGLAPTLARKVAMASGRSSTARCVRSALRVLLVATASVSVVYPVLTLAGVAPGGGVALVTGWLFAFIYAVYFGLKMILFALDRIVEYTRLELTSDVIFFVVLGLLLAFIPSWSLAAFGAAYGCFIVLSVRRLPLADETRIHVDRGTLRYAGLATVATWSSVARLPLTVALAGVLSDSESVARFAAVAVLIAPLFLVPQAAGMLTFAAVSRNAAKADYASIRSITRAISTFAGQVAVAVALISSAVIGTVLGGFYSSASWSFVLIVCGLVPQLVATPIANALAAEGRVGLTASVSVSSTLLTVIAALFLVPRFGELGAAGSFAVGSAASGSALLLVGVARRLIFRRDLEIGLLGALVALPLSRIEMPVAVVLALLFVVFSAYRLRVKNE